MTKAELAADNLRLQENLSAMAEQVVYWKNAFQLATKIEREDGIALRKSVVYPNVILVEGASTMDDKDPAVELYINNRRLVGVGVFGEDGMPIAWAGHIPADTVKDVYER